MHIRILIVRVSHRQTKLGETVWSPARRIRSKPVHMGTPQLRRGHVSHQYPFITPSSFTSSPMEFIKQETHKQTHICSGRLLVGLCLFLGLHVGGHNFLILYMCVFLGCWCRFTIQHWATREVSGAAVAQQDDSQKFLRGKASWNLWVGVPILSAGPEK